MAGLRGGDNMRRPLRVIRMRIFKGHERDPENGYPVFRIDHIGKDLAGWLFNERHPADDFSNSEAGGVARHPARARFGSLMNGHQGKDAAG